MSTFDLIPVLFCFPLVVIGGTVFLVWRFRSWLSGRRRMDSGSQPAAVPTGQAPRTSETADNRGVMRWQRERDTVRYLENVSVKGR